MSLVARSKEKWLFSEATAVQNEREGEVDPVVCEEMILLRFVYAQYSDKTYSNCKKNSL